MIDKFLEWSLKNRFLVITIYIAVAVWGYWAMLKTPIDAIPDLSENQILVYADWEGRSPKEVEDQITYPLSANLKGLAGVKSVRSSSAFGFSMINVIFEDNIDIYFARTRILERLALSNTFLPKGVTPVLGPDSTGIGQIYWYYLEGGEKDLAELRSIQDWYIKQQLGSVPGVAEVSSIGGYVKQYQIELDPIKMASKNISIMDIVKSIDSSNVNIGAKVLEQHGIEYAIRGVGLLTNTEDIENTLVMLQKDTPVLIRDIADVTIGPEFRRGLLDKAGEEVVGGVIVMRQGESASVVIEKVKQKIQEITSGLPKGVKIIPFYDRSKIINRAVDTLSSALIEELILVTLAHILFLAHFRSILIVTLPLPLAILISFLFMHYFGITSNIMSLGGIAIAIGVLVDAGIVVTENVIRHAEEENDDSNIWAITLKASKLVARPIFFSMAIIILAFVPVFALTGQEGKLFHPLAFTKTFAMAGSTILAVSLVPVLCTFLVRGPYHSEDKNKLMRILIFFYKPILSWALSHRFIVIMLALSIFSVAIKLITTIGSEFMPPLNEGDLLFMPVTAPSVSLTEATKLVQIQDKQISSVPEVLNVVGKVGRVESATDPAPISMFETLIELKPTNEWREGLTKEKLLAELDAKTKLPGVTNIWTQPIINRIDMLATGIRTQVGVKIFGPDINVLEDLAVQIKNVLEKVPGVADLYAEKITGSPYLEFNIKRLEAARNGLSVAEIQDFIEVSVGGKKITTIIENRARYPVQIRYGRSFRQTPEQIGQLLIRTQMGKLVPLSSVADINIVNGPNMISSENGLLRVYVLMNIRGRDVGSFIKEAMDITKNKVTPPQGYFWEWSGQFENQIRARNTLNWVIPLVFCIIFILLSITYQSAKEAAHVILAVPFALSGGVFLQYILGYPFSVAVWVGYIALFGTAVQTGVVMVIYLEEAVKKNFKRITSEGRDFIDSDLKNAILEGALLRLRPKVMTVSTVVAGLLPLFWTERTGSEVMQPLATPVLGGMISSLLHVLIVTPVIFYWIRKRELKTAHISKN